MAQQGETMGKPVPEIEEAWRPFYKGARQRRLMIAQCQDCRTYVHPGAVLCTQCWSEKVAWVQASGKGTLFTFGIMHQRYHPGFAGEIPYNVAVVELEEGPRLNTNIVGVKNEDLRVGMPVRVVFEDLNDRVTIPKFTPA